MSTEQKKIAPEEDTRVFDTSGFIDSIITLQRENPNVKICMFDIVKNQLSSPEKEKYLDYIEKCTYEYLKEKNLLTSMKPQLPPVELPYKLFREKDYHFHAWGYDNFIKAYSTLEDAMEDATKYIIRETFEGTGYRFKVVFKDEVIKESWYGGQAGTLDWEDP